MLKKKRMRGQGENKKKDKSKREGEPKGVGGSSVPCLEGGGGGKGEITHKNAARAQKSGAKKSLHFTQNQIGCRRGGWMGQKRRKKKTKIHKKTNNGKKSRKKKNADNSFEGGMRSGESKTTNNTKGESDLTQRGRER